METVEILPAESADHKLLTQITFEGKGFWGYSQTQLLSWERDLTITSEYIEENEIYKLLLNGEIIGYYSYLMVAEMEIKLDYLFLSPKYIGKGYGKLLMLDFLLKVQAEAAKRIILEAEPQAENFYKKFGFITYGKRESSIKDRFLPQMKLDLI